MPEELRDLMGRAVDGPVAPVDADDVWKRGSRQRRMHRIAQIAPIVVIVALVIGLVVVATGDDQAAPVFADLTEEDQAVVDEYLGVLEERGVLGEFPDERAAVEYAWRVECFGEIDDATLFELSAAVSGVVSALTLETAATVGRRTEVADDGELAAAREATDEAIADYEAAVEDLPPEVMSPAQAEALEVARMRIEAFSTLRQAADDQVHPTLQAMADGFVVTAEDLMEVDRQWSMLASGEELLQLSRLQDYSWHQIAATDGMVALAEVLSLQSTDNAFERLQAELEEEDERLAAFIEWATPEQKTLQRGQGAEQVRAYEEVVADALSWGARDFQGPPPASVGEALDAATEALQVRVQVADQLAAELRSVAPDPSVVDAAVGAACEATGDQILLIGPAAVGGEAATLPTTSQPSRAPDSIPASPPDEAE